MKRLQWVFGLVCVIIGGGCSGSQSSSLDVNDVCQQDNKYTAYTCKLNASTTINLCLDDCTFPSWCPKNALTLGDTTRVGTNVGCSTLGSQPPPKDTCIVHGINNCLISTQPSTQYTCKECQFSNNELTCTDSNATPVTLDLSLQCG